MSAAMKRMRVVIGLGSAQTLAFGSTYYLPAILAEPIARELGVSRMTLYRLMAKHGIQRPSRRGED